MLKDPDAILSSSFREKPDNFVEESKVTQQKAQAGGRSRLTPPLRRERHDINFTPQPA
jgi:hypothetical protein